MLEDDAGFADSNETHAKLQFSVSGFVQFETVIFLKELISFPCKICHRVGIIDKVAVSLAKVALVGLCPSCGWRELVWFDLLEMENGHFEPRGPVRSPIAD